MKKFIALLLLLSLLFTLVACKPSDDNPDTQQPPAENSEDEMFEPDEALVVELVYYLKNRLHNYQIENKSFDDKTNRIKNGDRALYVSFNSSEKYFVCAYLDADTCHDSESPLNCCVDDYVWVGFDKQEIIPVNYEGKSLIEIFQIDVSSHCEDLLDPDATPTSMVHFRAFEMGKTEQGYEAFSQMEPLDSFIYLDTSNEETVYYSNSTMFHKNNTLRLAEVDGKAYIILCLIDDDTEIDLVHELGEYYDLLIEHVVYGNYSYVNTFGTELKYATIAIDDIVDNVFVEDK